MARRTRSAVSGLTDALLCKVRETVAIETLARFATCLMFMKENTVRLYTNEQERLTTDIDSFDSPALLCVLQYGHSSIMNLNLVRRPFVHAENAGQGHPNESGMCDHRHALLFRFLYKRLQFSFYPQTKLRERFTPGRGPNRIFTQPGTGFCRRFRLNLGPDETLPFTKADFTQTGTRNERQSSVSCNCRRRIISPL